MRLEIALVIISASLLVLAGSGVLGVIDGCTRAARDIREYNKQRRAAFQKNIRELIVALGEVKEESSAHMLRVALHESIRLYREHRCLSS